MISRNKGIFSLEFLVPNVGLLLAILSVETWYATIVRPNAEELLIKRKVMASQNTGSLASMQERSVYLIIMHREPECEVIFFLWGMMVLSYKFVQIGRERSLFKHDFVRVQPGERIIPDDALDRYKELKSAVEREPRWRERLLPECMLAALHRFSATNSVRDAADAEIGRAS